MNILTKSIDSLIPAPYNPRLISPDAMSGLKESIETFGYVEPIIWNKRTGFIVGGHQRVEAMKILGFTEVDVVEVDLDQEKEKTLNVALNNRHIAGDWAPDITAMLNEIKKDDERLFDDLNLGELLAETNDIFSNEHGSSATGSGQIDSKQPICSNGDIWQLNETTLNCGTNTKECDSIIKTWQKSTSSEAVRSDGVHFDTLLEDRGE